MSRYPPKLVDIAGGDGTSILFLDNGETVTVDISPARLNEAIIEQRVPPLADLIAAQSFGVYVDTLDTTPEEWERISHHLCRSARAEEVLESFPVLWDALHSPYAVIAGMSHRVYGGISVASMYTSCPISFSNNPNRPAPWQRALLSARGDWLFETWVHLDDGRIEIEPFQRPGHYVE
jgi:hypothetical protein